MTCKKVGFSEERYALKYIEKLQASSKRTVVPVRAYLCESCLNWHLTSEELREVSDLKKQLAEKDAKIAKLETKVKHMTQNMEYQKKKIVELRGKLATLKRYDRITESYSENKGGLK